MPAIQPLNIHVGRGDVYIDVDVPTTPPVPLVGQGVPATGRGIGATLDASNWIYRPTTFDIRTQQDTGVVGYVITEEDVRLEFVLGEITYQNLRDIMIGAKDQGSFITVGGNIVPVIKSVLIVAPKRDGSGGFIEAMIYQAAFTEDRTFTFSRAGQMAVRVVARSQAVLTRAQGDRQGFVHQNVSL